MLIGRVNLRKPLARKEALVFSTLRFNAFISGLPLLFLPTIAGFGQTGDYLSELAAARQEVIHTETLTIQKLELGEPHPGKNRFTALVKNKTNNTVTLGLDLRTEPGIWPSGWQRQFLLLVWPGGEREIEAEYEFSHLTPQATLRVRFFLPQVAAGGVTQFGDFFFQKKYSVGRGNKAVDYDLSQRFLERDSEHFRIYFFPSSLAARELSAITAQRESTFQKISELIGVAYPEPVRLFFFPDGETKRRETGHTGDGWAFDRTIVEVYNEQTKLDPYHELTHILAGRLGDPPALFNEGFAVYVSELMGADALKALGSPGKKVDEAVVAHRSEGKFIPLDKLFAFSDIGPEESQPTISYAEAASFVKFLIAKYQLEKFRQAYKSLQNSDDEATIHKNQQAFRAIYGKLPSELEPEWLNSLGAQKK
jgi:hypothetical protein